MTESNITKKILISSFVNIKSRLFRNNTGTGWIGKIKSSSNPTYKVIENARPLKAGLCLGSSDLIGWTKITIDESMVGKEVAVFTAIEVKTPKGKASKEQINFINQVLKSGGLAGVAKNEEDAINIINRF